MKKRAGVAVLAVLSSLGCVADTEERVQPFDPNAGLRLELPATDGPRAAPSPLRRGRIAQGLTLEEAKEIALEANPGLAANAESVNMAKAQIVQAGLFTNPVFAMGKDDWPLTPGPGSQGHDPTDALNGSNHARALDLRQGKLWFSLSKDIDVSGKRVARVDGAIESERSQEAQYASAAFQLEAQVRVAYASVLVAQKNVGLAGEADEMARHALAIVSGRAALGNGLPADALRAEADAARAASDLAVANRDLANAKRALTTLLGDPDAVLGPLRGDLPLTVLPADLDDEKLVAWALEHNADVIAAKRAVLAAQASRTLQERSIVPDVTVSVQLNRYVLDDDETMFFSVGLPLPIFDHNQAQVAQALAALHQAEWQERATESSVLAGVRTDLQVLRTSAERIRQFSTEIVPRDREAVNLIELSYEGGKILYLDVITARQAFNQARADYVSELLTYETTLADLERLLAKPLDRTAP